MKALLRKKERIEKKVKKERRKEELKVKKEKLKVEGPLTDTKKFLTCEICKGQFKRKDFHLHLLPLPHIRRNLCVKVDRHTVQIYIKQAERLIRKRTKLVERHIEYLQENGMRGKVLELAKLKLTYGMP